MNRPSPDVKSTKVTSPAAQRYDVTHVTLLPLSHNALLAFELWTFRTVTFRVTWKRLIVTQVGHILNQAAPRGRI